MTVFFLSANERFRKQRLSRRAKKNRAGVGPARCISVRTGVPCVPSQGLRPGPDTGLTESACGGTLPPHVS
jgi:hypothetical protein